jgi:preprotein translocase subunit SecA
MLQKIANLIVGDPNEKVLDKLREEVEKINALEDDYQNLSDEELKSQTDKFKERLGNGEALEDMVYEAFAVVREAAKRNLQQRHYDVQMMGGLTMFRGNIAEMRTGEGKTLTSTAPLYTHALTGKGCHLVTVNDYLAKRDAVWMGQIYHALGLTVGCVAQEGGYVYDPDYKHEDEEEAEEHDEERDTTGAFKVHMDYLKPVDRNDAYEADITYGTNNQFGFDYLRDNMAQTYDQQVMRDLHFCIIDEIDSILIDEARTPLIISAPAEQSNEMYRKFAGIVKDLEENKHYNVDEKMRAATYTEEGIEALEEALGIDNLYAVTDQNLQHYAESALKAHALYERDDHYVVKDGEVVIVDEFTGRLMKGRRFGQGLHQAIEAKEGVNIQRESKTMATVTFQNFFRMYDRLAGMTGTAATEAEEFGSIYDLEVTVIPTNRPVQREDLPDRVYSSRAGKYKAVVREIRERHEKGQPVLVGTASIEKNELIGKLLSREGIPHNLLNAKNHMSEGETIAQAGQVGAVTVATNMAGRGVDIMLGGNPPDPKEKEKVKELGGLHVLGTERHESRRIDNQLRGRAGRQGDPGSTQFYVSMEDDLMRIFGSDRVKGVMDTLNIPEDMPIENAIVTNSIEKAQKRVENHHFDTRKRLLEYDDVLNKHREAVYKRRDDVLDAYHDGDKQELRESILALVEQEVEQVVMFHTGEVVDWPGKEDQKEGDWDPEEIVEVVDSIVPLDDDQGEKLLALTHEAQDNPMDLAEERDKIINKVMEVVREAYDRLEELFADERDQLRNVERGVMLRAIDTLWVDHLASMRALRTGIGLRGYGQRDPLIEYKKESYGMFQRLLVSINQEIVYSFFKRAKHAVDVKAQRELQKSLLQQSGVQLSGAAKTMKKGQNQQGGNSQKASENDKRFDDVGRNDPCPCGATKDNGKPLKYKYCHGR